MQQLKIRRTLGDETYYTVGTLTGGTARVHGNERLLPTERFLNKLKGPSDKELKQLELELKKPQ